MSMQELVASSISNADCLKTKQTLQHDVAVLCQLLLVVRLSLISCGICTRKVCWPRKLCYKYEKWQRRKTSFTIEARKGGVRFNTVRYNAFLALLLLSFVHMLALVAILCCARVLLLSNKIIRSTGNSSGGNPGPGACDSMHIIFSLFPRISIHKK